MSPKKLFVLGKKKRLRLFMNEMKHNPSGVFDNGICGLLEIALGLTFRLVLE
jgi:hypothetical protein